MARVAVAVISGFGCVVKESYRSSLNLSRGLCGTILCAFGGALAAVALALGFTVCRWLVSGATEIDRQYDLRSLEKDMVGPVVGCVVVCACAGWATFAPAGTYRFAQSLVVIFLLSLALWYVIGSMELTPRRYKDMEHPEFYASELMVVIGPPIMAAAVLTAVRNRGALTSPPSQKSKA